MPEQKPRKTFLEQQKEEAYENWYGVDGVYGILPVSMLFMFITCLAGYDYFLIKYNTFNTLGCWIFLAGIPAYFIIYIPLMVRMYRLKRKLKKILDEITLELKAEKEVAGTLKTLDPKTYYVYNGLSLGFGDIDHIIVGPTGIFVIETKANRDTVGVSANGYLTIEGGDTPHKDYRKQAIGNGLQLKFFLNEHIREMNLFITIFLCFLYAKQEKVIVLTSRKDNFVIPCLTKEQVVQGIYQTTGSALNHERILVIKRALDEWEEGMQEEN